MVNKKHILTFLLFLISFFVNGQQGEIGLPYVENISSARIGYSGDLIEIAQDAENVMYFTHEKGVVVFDGASWNLLPTRGTPTIIKRKNGYIVVGFENFIGEISVDNVRQRNFVPLIDSATNVGLITSIVEYQDVLFFVARGNVYSLKDGIVEKIDVPKTKKLFVDRTGIVASNNQSSWICTDLKKGFSLKKDVVIDGIVRTNTGLIVHTGTGFKSCESLADEEWQSLSVDIDSDITSFVKLVGDEICVGVSLKGIYCFSKQGSPIFMPSLSIGLSDSKINGMFVDKNGNLWVTHGHGVSRLELTPAISYFNEKIGLEGSVKSVLRVDGRLYVATDRGVFVLKGNAFVSVLHTPCNQLVQYKKSLIAATKNGLYKIDGEKAEHVSLNREQIIYVYENYLISIGDGIFSVWKDVQHANSSLIPVYQQMDLPDIEVSTIAIEKREKQVAMLGTKNDGVWMMGIDSAQQFYIKKCPWQGIPRNFQRTEVYETAIGVVFSTEDGIYRCDVENGFFYKDTKVQIPADMGKLRLMPVVEDDDKNLWFSLHKEGRYENQVAVAWNTNNFERYTIILAPFAKLRNFNTNVIFPENNSIVWLGGEDGLVRMDFNKVSVRKTLGDVCFTKISTDDDSLLSQLEQNIVLPYGTKSIVFDYVAIEYENHEDIFYSYFLEGQDEIWSPPTQTMSKEYTNLPPGKYVFHVIAKRASGASSRETIFSFEIKHHPLLTPWAFVVYLILLIVIGIWFSKIHARRLLRETKMMNALVEKKIKSMTEEKQISSAKEDSPEEDLVQSQSYELATVLFSDFKGFSKLAEKLSADSLIKELDTYFSEFDTIISRYNVEKIKTVGDSYMCAGGIPKRNTTNPIEVVAAALEMQYRIKEMQKNHEQNDEIWGVRIGVHTGPVIAGVVGSKNNLSYDIWGDSVNVADRMESAGEVGKVNISESTYLLVQDFFDCEYRGKIAVKGKEEKLDMYFVIGFKQEFAKEGNTSLPNNVFYNKFALLRFESLQEQVCRMFDAKLPKTYFYHSIKHTLDVVIQAEMIAIAEGVDDESLYILKTAALLHDIGFLQAYDNHENVSVDIAKDILQKEGYSQSQIDDVCRLILSTKLGTEPKDLLEKVLCDANFDYLGRDDFSCVSKNLYKELLELRKIKKNEYEWNVGQLKFLQEHKFYTNYSRSKRNPTKVKHIQDIQEKITRFNI